MIITRIEIMKNFSRKVNRRQFLKESTTLTASAAGAAGLVGCFKRKEQSKFKKIIVIGFDGMDPVLTERMIDAGELPTLKKMRRQGGYRRLGTSIPPQSPVAWSNFITGAGPGTHSIFDFLHRNPEDQYAPFFAFSETIPGKGGWEVGDHKLPLTIWPFNNTATEQKLQRKGVPFWDYLDKEGIESTFYNLPSNYPPSKSKHGHHRCLAGLGTPDLLGGHGTYQHFAEDGPIRTKDVGGGLKKFIFFEEVPPHTVEADLTGPSNSFLEKPKNVKIKFKIHRDLNAKAAVIDIQGQRILLKEGQWSSWIQLDFALKMPALLPDEHLNGICRFYLQELTPNLRLYVTPLNTDPSNDSLAITEPPEFISEISDKLGLFSTTGFQEDHKALSTNVFTETEFMAQADYVLQERLNLLQYSLDNYDDGVLFFYFSSTDLQSHMLWWDNDDKHPTRSSSDARQCFKHLQGVYRKMDQVVSDILKRYGDKALVMVISDHGFGDFKRQFGLNTWLRNNGYLYPANCKNVMFGADWDGTTAYGLGLNGLYLNMAGREQHGIVKTGPQREKLLQELAVKLEAVRDVDGAKVINKVYRADQCYSYTEPRAKIMTPDLIIGYNRRYRYSWATGMGGMDDEIIFDNDSAWSADHCGDGALMPGVLFCNRPVTSEYPRLIDIAPTIINEYGLKTPSSMTGKNIFAKKSEA